MSRLLRASCLLIASVLLLAGSPSGTAQETSRHVIFQSIRRGDEVLLQNLLRGGTPADLRASDGTTPLMDAALHGSARMVALLLEHGADPRLANHRGATALLWGAADAEKVRLLLEAGSEVDARSALGNTPLLVAAASPSGAASVEQLIAGGADITARSKAGRTPLRNAVTGGDLQTVGLLLGEAQRRAKLAEVVHAAGPTIAIAAGNGFEEMVDLLLEHGADPNRTTGSRGHGLNAALLAGEANIARKLILRDVDFDRQIQPGDVPTALLAAYTEVDDPSLVRLLQARDVDFSAVNHHKETALTWARLRGHRALIKTLQDLGADEGETPSSPEIPSRPINLHAGNQTALIAEAVQKSVDLLQLASDTFLDVRSNCVSCHHQNLPSVAIGWARDRGFAVRQATFDRMAQRQVKSWEPRVERAYQLDSPFPVPPRFLGWGMWGFAELGYQPDQLTRAISWYLAATQQADGRWVPGMLRPPMGGDEILSTMLAMRALQLYSLVGRERETAARVERARRWLEDAEPRTHQEQVCRMLGLGWAGTPAESLVHEVESLLALQRDDGGWAQLPELKSDAWATGQTLVALHIAGGLPTTHSAYRRGIEWLLKTQFDDGSWYVQTRTWPFQAYFESKFPHGRDQWISAPGTAWAVMALVLVLEPSDVARLDIPSAYDAAEEEDPPPAGQENANSLPAAVAREVDFVKDVLPLFKRSCYGCHGDKEAKSNLSLTSRAALLGGGDSEVPAIQPGTSGQSPLVRFAAGLEKDMEMPPLEARAKYPPLAAEEIALLRGWIDQGAKWPGEAE